MKWFQRTLPVLLAVFAVFAVSGCKKEPKDRQIRYFYEEVCAACDAPGEFRALFDQKTDGLSLPEEAAPIICNIFSNGGEESWRALCREQGIPEEEQILPMVVTPAGWVSGDAIASGLRQLVCKTYGFLDDRTYTYYYRPDCSDCLQTEPGIEEAFAARPDLSLIRIDTTAPEPKAAFKSLLETMQVPEEEWQVPFLLCGDRYLSGADAILEKLTDFLNP